MTTPRTLAGQAALSALRPHLKKALAHTILAIEDQAVAPYVEALKRLAPVDLDPAIPDDQVLTSGPGAEVRARDYRAARALLAAAAKPG